MALPTIEVWGFNEILASLAAQGNTTAQLVLDGVNIPRATILQTLESNGWQQLGGAASNTFYTAVEANAGNGLATVVNDVSTITVAENAELATTTITGTGAGAGILAMDVGLAGAAIAPALGVLAGVGLYNIAPEFWDGVAENLMSAGKLVNGKIQGLINKDGTTSFDEETIEIFKQAFVDAGYFEKSIVGETIQNPTGTTPLSNVGNVTDLNTGLEMLHTYMLKCFETMFNEWGGYGGEKYFQTTRFESSFTSLKNAILSDSSAPQYMAFTNSQGYSGEPSIFLFKNATCNIHVQQSSWYGVANLSNFGGSGVRYSCNLSYYTYDERGHLSVYDPQLTYNRSGGWNALTMYMYTESLLERWLSGATQGFDLTGNGKSFYSMGVGSLENSPDVQDGATFPDNNPFTQTYPTWQPNKVIENNNYYPVAMPTDDMTQDPSQDGENVKDKQIQYIFDIIYNPNPEPQPEPIPDPDTQPDPKPQPEPEPDTQTNPINPNPKPDPSDPTPILPVLDSFSADSLFCVYNPTDTELDSLGAYLWDSSIIEQVKRIWQNPIDGVIALHKIYAAPTTGSAKNIKLGYLDTGVSANVVTSQFVEVDCGSILVVESKNNATDYIPFTQIQIYLPFIGIQELDTNEIMGGTVNLKYRVDVYTGTCVALIYVTRSPDMATAQLLYTFSGNASQKLPLTASDFGGAISALLGVVGVGVASGGALAATAGMGVAHSLTSEMVHIQHSGGLSANSGLLAPRTPFIIISRQAGYDANAYYDFYGFPANKTVYLSNCMGYTRVKDILYKGDGTDEEKTEIVNLLKEGVII